jgi:hypothetical protein
MDAGSNIGGGGQEDAVIRLSLSSSDIQLFSSGRDPMATFHFGGGQALIPSVPSGCREIRKRASFNPNFLQVIKERAQKLFAEAGSDSPGEFEIFAFVKANEQRAEVFPSGSVYGCALELAASACDACGCSAVTRAAGELAAARVSTAASGRRACRRATYSAAACSALKASNAASDTRRAA